MNSKIWIEKTVVKVTFDNGDHLTTGINCNLDGAKAYYLGKVFNIGNGENDLMATAVKVEDVTL